MKKRIAILSLVALFFSVVSMSAQTAKPAPKAEGTTKSCCKGKTDPECKKMTSAQKTACTKDSAKVGGKSCCTKKK